MKCKNTETVHGLDFPRKMASIIHTTNIRDGPYYQQQDPEQERSGVGCQRRGQIGGTLMRSDSRG